RPTALFAIALTDLPFLRRAAPVSNHERLGEHARRDERARDGSFEALRRRPRRERAGRRLRPLRLSRRRSRRAPRAPQPRRPLTRPPRGRQGRRAVLTTKSSKSTISSFTGAQSAVEPPKKVLK